MAASRNFAAEEFPDAGELCRFAPASFDGGASGRHFINHGEIEVAVERESERAGDGSSGHHKNVRRIALLGEALALEDAETMLLVHDDHAELFEYDGIFDQGMRADDNLCFAAFGARECGILH